MKDLDIFTKNAIIRRVESKYFHQHQITEDYEKTIRNYAPNFKHSDGRIYASKPGDSYWVVTVSPYHPKFRSQIEDGVWPIVEQLVNKGYLTVSSCEGHGTENKMIVSLVFKDRNSAEKFIDYFKEIPGWYFEIYDKTRHCCHSARSGNSVICEKTEIELNEHFEEFKRYDIIFFRNYKKYVYLDMKLYKFPKNPFMRFLYRFCLRKPDRDFYKNKKHMLDFLKNKLPYSES